MSLDNTKATPPKSTETRSQGSAPAASTEKLLVESKSTFGKPSSKGCQSEAEVARQLEESGFQIVAERLKTPFAEVDLLVRSPEGALILVEVKSSDWPRGEWAGFSQGQKRRLERARRWIEVSRGEDVGFRLMSPGGECFDESVLCR